MMMMILWRSLRNFVNNIKLVTIRDQYHINDNYRTIQGNQDRYSYCHIWSINSCVVWVCVCVCILYACVFVYVYCMHVCVCVYIHNYYVRAYMCVFICVCVYVHMQTHNYSYQSYLCKYLHYFMIIIIEDNSQSNISYKITSDP